MTDYGIQSTVRENMIHYFEGQAVAGFSIIVHNNLEFEGTYHFTEAYTWDSAHELIFSGEALNSDDNEVNQ